MNCNECNKVVSYYTHESDMARLERTIHRLWTIIIILIAALVCLCVGFFIYESQYEHATTTTTTEDVSQYVDSDGMEEIEDAEKYAKCALEYKGKNNGLADVFFQLSLEEMQHMNRLHKAVVDAIQDYRANNGEPPANMMAIYDYLHKKQIDKATEVKNIQSMYRE